MKTSITITLELSQDEAIALAKLLGALSCLDYEKHGLNSAQSSIVSNVYGHLISNLPEQE